MTDILGSLMLVVLLVAFTITATVCVFRPWMLPKGLWSWKRGVPYKEGHAEMLRLRRDDPAESLRHHSVQILALRLVGVVMYCAVVSVLLKALLPDAR